MYGASWPDIVIVLVICYLPALAVLLSVFSTILAFIRVTRMLSLVLAFLCLVIYVIFVMGVMQSELFKRELDSLPAGRLFHSLIPLAVAIAIIGFDIYALIKRKPKS